MQLTTEKIPSYALCYLINGDKDTLTDNEIKEIENWMDKSGIKEVLPPDEENETYFTHSPAFGLPCDVIECPCVLDWN